MPRASAAPRSKPSYHHGDLPAALMAAVEEVINDRGLDAVTLREVARRVGVSHAAPAHHFGDKEGLLTAFATQGFVRFAEALRSARADLAGRPPSEQLMAMGVAYVRFAVQHPAFFEVMFRPELTAEDDPQMKACGGEAFEVLLEAVTACLAADTEEAEVLRVASAAWAMSHGLATLWVDGPLGEMTQAGDAETTARAVLPVLLDGIGHHPAFAGDAPPES